MTGLPPVRRRSEGIVELDDVQSIVLHAFTELGEAAYLLIELRAASDVAGWLDAVASEVRGGEVNKDAQHRTAVQIAISHAGFEAIGLEPRARLEFSTPFREGMCGSEQRSRQLGDVGDSAPCRWWWGGARGPVHAVLLLFARDLRELQDLVTRHTALLATHGLATSAPPLRASWPQASGVEGLREQFGFVDGISQPEFRLRASDAAGHLAPGELLLGYRDESGEVALGPTVLANRAALAAGLAPAPGGRCDLGRNGTYLVLRQIEQRVQDFWRFVRAQATPELPLELCAAKLVGRWRNGEPLTTTLAQPADLNGTVSTRNDFNFVPDDESGERCPIGAHVRRSYPRDGMPGLGPRSSLAVTRRHRILRRGRPYGAPVPGWPDPERMLAAPDSDGPRGMHFLCMNASIARQFEFVQQRWINDPTFANQRHAEVDPFLGELRPPGVSVLRARPVSHVLQRTVPLTRFTKVVGGEYFFLPSLRALRYLAAIAPRARS